MKPACLAPQLESCLSRVRTCICMHTSPGRNLLGKLLELKCAHGLSSCALAMPSPHPEKPRGTILICATLYLCAAIQRSSGNIKTNLGTKADVGQNRKLASRTFNPLRKAPQGNNNKNDHTTPRMSPDRVLRVGVGRSRPYSDFAEK